MTHSAQCIEQNKWEVRSCMRPHPALVSIWSIYDVTMSDGSETFEVIRRFFWSMAYFISASNNTYNSLSRSINLVLLGCRSSVLGKSKETIENCSSVTFTCWIRPFVTFTKTVTLTLILSASTTYWPVHWRYRYVLVLRRNYVKTFRNKTNAETWNATKLKKCLCITVA